MSADQSFEEELLGLIRDAERDRRTLQARREAIDEQIEETTRKIAAHHTTLDSYREKYGIKKEPVVTEATDDVRVAYQNLTQREMIRRWADEHDGRVDMNEIGVALSTAKLFKSKAAAYSSLYSIARRMKEFERVSPGVYERRNEVQAPMMLPLKNHA